MTRFLTKERAILWWVGILCVSMQAVWAAAQDMTDKLGNGISHWLVGAARIQAGVVSYSTGIVVSADGDVLLSSDFAATGGDVYILDGGMDPARFGREVEVVRESNLEGLIVVNAKGLSRSPIHLARRVPDARESVQLLGLSDPAVDPVGVAAIREFSRAEYTRDGELTVSQDSLLPNITGAVTNACGELFGISIARGAPSLAGTGTTGYVWLDRLGDTLIDVNKVVAASPCDVRFAMDEVAVAAAELESPSPTRAGEFDSAPPVTIPPAPDIGQSAADGAGVTQIPSRGTLDPEISVWEDRQEPVVGDEEGIRSVQRSMRELELYTGDITGTLDEDTRDAMNRFRERKGLPPQSIVTLSTLRLLIQEMEIAELRQDREELAQASEVIRKRSDTKDREIVGLQEMTSQIEEEKTTSRADHLEPEGAANTAGRGSREAEDPRRASRCDGRAILDDDGHRHPHLFDIRALAVREGEGTGARRGRADTSNALHP